MFLLSIGRDEFSTGINQCHMYTLQGLVDIAVLSACEEQGKYALQTKACSY